MFLKRFHVLISVLQDCAGSLSEVVSNDSLDWSLWSIWATEGKLIIGNRNLYSAALKGVHAEWNPVIMTLSIFIVLWCCYISIDNCLVIQQFEIPWIMLFLVKCGFVNFP